jgi:hypothetical protein
LNDLFSIFTCDGSQIADIIFVHGLGGNPFSTWHSQGRVNDKDFWPTWLGNDLQNVAIWSLGYEVEPFKWRGSTMPLVDRATNSLAVLDSYEIGSRPLLFITHSMGGLLVKQMLRHAYDFGEPRWKKIVEQTKGIVFLSTPHSGSEIANWVEYIGRFLLPSISVEELKAHDPHLRELNNVYRNHDILSQIPIEVYCEKHKTSGLLVVNETSADPGIKGVIPIPVDFDHISICRPDSRNALIYRRITRFIKENLSLFPLPPLEEQKKNLKTTEMHQMLQDSVDVLKN